MQVTVDPNLCQGHARCWAICSEVFELDDEGLATAVRPDVPPELEDKVADAARNCPERAIQTS
jgi:ferredoxin